MAMTEDEFRTKLEMIGVCLTNFDEVLNKLKEAAVTTTKSFDYFAHAFFQIVSANREEQRREQMKDLLIKLKAAIPEMEPLREVRPKRPIKVINDDYKNRQRFHNKKI